MTAHEISLKLFTQLKLKIKKIYIKRNIVFV